MWLDVDPRWGTGWTGWAACYLFTDGFRDEERAEHPARVLALVDPD